MSDASQALRERIVAAREQGEKLQVRGGNSYALPSAASATEIGTLDHSGVISYDPTEMVIRVRCGTPLLEVQGLLAQQGQQLGVESPQLSARATVGGAVAMGLSGSSRPFTGALRDYVLGVGMINGLGEELNFGGQVMKNVAGYDVSRMLVGSCGSLGLLLDVSLRVLPIAEESLYLVFEKEDLAASVAFAHDLIVAAEPLTGASFYQGRLHLRFSGRQPSMERLRRELGGETDNALWWSALQQWQMPWAKSGAKPGVKPGAKPAWRSYRSHLSAEPQTGGQWLADWNGGLLWSEEEEPTAEASLRLEDMTPGSRSAGAGQMEDVQGRLRRAFDPEAVFVSGEER